MPKFYKQNKKRIDPRYFLEETTNRDDPPFEVGPLIKNRQQMGFAISTPDAYEIVRSRQDTAANERQRARERQARAASARQIGRGRSSAAANAGPPKGAKAHELFEWLKAHPEEAKRIAGRR